MENLTTDLALRGALLAMLVFGFSPRLVVRILVHAWPSGHPRRRELVAELGCVPYLERLVWVGELIETALLDGLPARWRKYREGLGVSRLRRRTPPSLMRLVFQSLVVAVLAFAGVAWLAFDRTVALTVDGETRKVRTFARTVEDVLNRMDLQMQPASVSPSLSTPLRDGLHITVRSGEVAARHDRWNLWPVVLVVVVAIAGAVAAQRERRGRGGSGERARGTR